MAAHLIDGKRIADQILEACAKRVAALKERAGVTPCLATVLVGDDPASATYVKMKGKRCEQVGMASRRVQMPASTTTDELLAELASLGSGRGVEITDLRTEQPSLEQVFLALTGKRA
jgi:methylenetetrahydrofolate dehydrogenase (NADP+)/methenyltetrahydrofolate cyclohydrolase